jgi:hypothetical protein
MEKIEIQIKNFLPEGYTLTEGSEISTVTLYPKYLEYKFNYEADFKKEIEFDPHEDDDFLKGKALEKKMVDGSIFNIEEGTISIKDIFGISKITKAYFKTEADEKKKRKSYTYEINVGDLMLSFETKEEQENKYEIIKDWFKINKIK